MTQIDFYTDVSDLLPYAARLVRKAYQLQRRIVIVLDATTISEFDDMLWSMWPTEFIPHVLASDPVAELTPILLIAADEGNEPELKFPHYDLQVNVSSQLPPQFSAFNRLCEIVPQQTNTVAVQAARERYAFYKQRGYALSNTKT